MEHMRMDPKHQFAAQYVLSRAAAERRERETLLAAVSASAQSSSLLGLAGMGPGKFIQCCHNKKVNTLHIAIIKVHCTGWPTMYKLKGPIFVIPALPHLRKISDNIWLRCTKRKSYLIKVAPF